MRKRIRLAAIIPMLFFCVSCEGAALDGHSNIRLPAVEGSFYPRRAAEIRDMLGTYLNEAQPASLEQEELVALVVPHAGYVFSGGVAAHAYRLLAQKKYDIIVLIGDSHHHRFSGTSVGDYDYYRTALGDVMVDRAVARALIEESGTIHFYPAAHTREHSLEVQLPFLQMVQKDAAIVPIILGERSPETCEALKDALIKHTRGKNVLFIASTDLSHFYPYQQAVGLDQKAIRAMEELDGEAFLSGIKKNEYELCGGGATATVMLIAQELGADTARLLRYANSGDVPFGDKARVVGYAAMAVTKTITVADAMP